ncbi:MAG TPA: phosphate butyryltransferase [candidate division Zixibacteria bacterium]
MKSLNDILNLAKRIGPKRVAVALAEDEGVLVALKRAKKENAIEGILVGTKEKIISLADKNEIDLKNFQVIDQPDEFEASLLCCELINQGRADVIMKGLVSTGTFMKAILYKEKGLEKGKLLSHVAVFEIPNYPKLLLITDAAINIAPNLAQKAQIIQNAIEVAHSLGIGNPLVACVAAVEKVNPKMPATVDAEALATMSKKGEIKGGIVDGPFGLDNAVSEESARIKGVRSPVAGKADIILAPDIECGNVIYKTLIEFGQAKCAAIAIGAKAPVILTSRADSDETKLMSIALGVVNTVKSK